MPDHIIFILLVTLLCGFFLAAAGTGMAADMESPILAGLPTALIGVYAGLIDAIRLGRVELPYLGVICLACIVIGAAAGCLSTVRGNPRSVVLSGSLLGLLGGLVVVPISLLGSSGGFFAGAIGGGLFGLLNSRRHPPA